MTRGEIWWVDLGIPFGREPGFIRPVLILQNNAYNESNLNTIIVAAITSNLLLAEAPGNILLVKKDTNLPKDSVLNVSQITTLDRERFTTCAGKLKAKQMESVEVGIRLVLGLKLKYASKS
jgi:mRNA interferase MazF